MNDSKMTRRDLKPALVFLSGELIAVPIPLEREDVILGRALEADVRVNDTQVSRQHAKGMNGGAPAAHLMLKSKPSDSRDRLIDRTKGTK